MFITTLQATYGRKMEIASDRLKGEDPCNNFPLLHPGKKHRKAWEGGAWEEQAVGFFDGAQPEAMTQIGLLIRLSGSLNRLKFI
jgi:hypothetical protein